jgi:TetR/AcrR family transcriptional regulator, transcriptional repressor for nem operon
MGGARTTKSVSSPAMKSRALPARRREPITPAGQRTRQELIDAGVAVAEREGLAGLSINAVVDEAGVAKGTFYVHFADRDAFIDALHLQFYARISAAVSEAVEHLAPGTLRLARGIEVYLDSCLADRAIKALILETRSDAHLTTTMVERERLFARLAEPSLKAMGWREPEIAARLLVAMTSEAALMELEAGKRLPAVRRSIERLIESAAKQR